MNKSPGIGSTLKTAARLPRGLALALALTAALGLGGCAVLTPSYSTEAETVAARGEPAAYWYNDDGTITLEYSTQPEGTSCLMVRVDLDGKVLRQWDALDNKGLARVKTGMTKDNVARLLGARRSERVYPGAREEVWDWNITHRGRGAATRFNVHFTDGRVRYVDRIRVYPPGEDGREEVVRDWNWDWEPWHPLYPVGIIMIWTRFGYWQGGGHWGGNIRHHHRDGHGGSHWSGSGNWRGGRR
ncbi:MAG: hypothetical protein LBE06_03335 [Azoarcus sp.]|jgi:hypothetical protein|nr:hypothetical protein [Azoarcus sp.]